MSVDRPVPPDALAGAEVVGYLQGVVDTAARLIGVVAAALGPDHPLIDRMTVVVGEVVERQHPEDDDR
jgi:hypothetical protein